MRTSWSRHKTRSHETGLSCYRSCRLSGLRRLGFGAGAGAAFFTEAYVSMSGCALVGLLCVPRPRRWFAFVALLFGLIGAFISWRGNVRAEASLQNLSQTPPARAQRWIQWSSTASGNNHYYALTGSATNWARRARHGGIVGRPPGGSFQVPANRNSSTAHSSQVNSSIVRSGSALLERPRAAL